MIIQKTILVYKIKKNQILNSNLKNKKNAISY